MPLYNGHFGLSGTISGAWLNAVVGSSLVDIDRAKRASGRQRQPSNPVRLSPSLRCNRMRPARSPTGRPFSAETRRRIFGLSVSRGSLPPDGVVLAPRLVSTSRSRRLFCLTERSCEHGPDCQSRHGISLSESPFSSEELHKKGRLSERGHTRRSPTGEADIRNTRQAGKWIA
jgi:hypothetical protein